MPATPEGKGRIIVGHAADDILGRIDAVDEGPPAKEAPREQQFQPDVVQVEITEHGQLKGAVDTPFWGGFGDGDDVDVMDHDFHAEQSDEKSDAVECRA